MGLIAGSSEKPRQLEAGDAPAAQAETGAAPGAEAPPVHEVDSEEAEDGEDDVIAEAELLERFKEIEKNAEA